MTRRLHEYRRDREEHLRAVNRRWGSRISPGRGRRGEWVKLDELQPESATAPAELDGMIGLDELEEVVRRCRLVGYVATAGLASGCYGWSADHTYLGKFFSRRDAVDAITAVARGVR